MIHDLFIAVSSLRRAVASLRHWHAPFLHVPAERPGSGTPGQWCSIANRDAIPALPAPGWL